MSKLQNHPRALCLQVARFAWVRKDELLFSVAKKLANPVEIFQLSSFQQAKWW
jgi:hypothetical protein